MVVGCGEAVGRFISKPPRQPKSNQSIRHVPNTDRETHRSAHQPTQHTPSVLVFFASLREPSSLNTRTWRSMLPFFLRVHGTFRGPLELAAFSK